MKKLLSNTASFLIIAIVAGCILGFAIHKLSFDTASLTCSVLVTVKMLSSQCIFFMVPLLILACVTPAIARLNGEASKILVYSMAFAFLSSMVSAFFSLGMSHLIVPSLNFVKLQPIIGLPESLLVNFEIPTINPMIALLLAIALGLGIVWSKYESAIAFLENFQKVVLSIMQKMMKTLLPLFVGSNFALLAYTGQISNMRVFLPIISLIVMCQLMWIVIMFAVASSYSGKNGWIVLKHYAKAYFTALGSMSSIVTLPVSMDCMNKSSVVEKKIFSFTLPLFTNSNLCGSIIAEMGLVTTTYYVFYNTLPPIMNLVFFAITACIISIGSAGVPGGLNVACSTILGSLILNGGEIDTFMGVMTALYTLQDGFGTACNVVTGGALSIMAEKKLDKSTSMSTSLFPLSRYN